MIESSFSQDPKTSTPEARATQAKSGRDGARPSSDNALCALLFHPVEGLLEELQVAGIPQLLAR